LGIGDWGLGIGDWGLGIGPNPQSPIPNPQSPIPNPHFKFQILFILKYIFIIINNYFFEYNKNILLIINIKDNFKLINGCVHMEM